MTSLIALEDVKPLLPIRAGNNAYDAQLTSLIAVATALIEQECRQTFAAGVRTERHTSRDATQRTTNLYGDGAATSLTAKEQIIPLRAAPVDPEAPVRVWYDPARKFGEETLLTEDDYVLDPEECRLFLKYPTRYAMSSLKVEYTAGYAVAGGTMSASLAANAPGLKHAAILTAVHLWNRTKPENVGSTDNDGGDGKSGKVNSYSIPEEALPFLAPYRRVLTGRG